MSAMWLFFIATGSVPEFAERPAEIALHLVAEFATAALFALALFAVIVQMKRVLARSE